MSAFAGHLSFPGGRIDPSDADPLATALRETREEIGLDHHAIRVLGHFTEVETHLGTLVVCYAGAIRPRDVPSVATSPREVEEILYVPVASLLQPGRSRPNPAHRAHYVTTAYEGRRLGSLDGSARTLHYWTLTNGHTKEPTVLWGLTGELVFRFLRAAHGWEAPPPRIVGRVEDLEP